MLWNWLKQLRNEDSRERIEYAIVREKQLKAGSRKTKNNLIRSMNPTWKYLLEKIKDIMTE